MFRHLARFVTRKPWIVVLLWVVGVVAIYHFGPSYLDAVSHHQLSMLPASAESSRADQLAARAFPGTIDRAQGTFIVVDRAGLGPHDSAIVADLATWLTSASGPGHIATIQTPTDPGAQFLTSGDHKAYLVAVTFDTRVPAVLDKAVGVIEQHVSRLNASALAPGQQVGFTSQVSFNHDLSKSALGSGSNSSQESLARLLGLLIVLIVLALVYRSPLAVLMPLLAIGMVIFVGPVVTAALSNLTGLPISSFSESFVIIVTLGAGTNYGLFLISRYREELLRGSERRAALEDALTHVGEAITSSASVVVLAMGMMGFAKLDFFRSLGPAVAVSIALMLLAGLSLMPALVALCGGAFFWPTRPHSTASGVVESRFWAWIGRAVVRYPAQIAVVAVLVLLPLAFTSLSINPSFDLGQSLPQDTPSAQGLNFLKEHFPESLAQTTFYLHAPGGVDLQATSTTTALAAVTRAVEHVPHVTVVLGPTQLEGTPGAQDFYGVDGATVRLQVLLNVDATSNAATRTVNAMEKAVRDTLRGTTLAGAQVLATGQPAQARDQQSLLGRDFILVGALVSLAILLVLGLLLRSLIMPLYLLATVALSTGTAIGVTSLYFQHARNAPIFYTTPLFGFVFLVALGEDFNIFMMSRLREETRRFGLRVGIERALATTGGVISSCGVVMAATFLILARNPLVIEAQIGVVVVVGVLLDTFLVRPVLVPALVWLLGDLHWRWPGRRSMSAVSGSAVDPSLAESERLS